jgi:hypothetical protein
MSAPVSRVTIHHEGDGVPRVVNLAYAGYSAAVFPETHSLWRPPWTSWGTYHYNHVSLDVVLTGNRMVYPVTDDELVQLGKLCDEARGMGWIVDAPDVFPHRQSFNTACPGDLVIARWSDVVAAVLGHRSAPKPAPAASAPLPKGKHGMLLAPPRLQRDPHGAPAYVDIHDDNPRAIVCHNHCPFKEAAAMKDDARGRYVYVFANDVTGLTYGQNPDGSPALETVLVGQAGSDSPDHMHFA